MNWILGHLDLIVYAAVTIGGWAIARIMPALPAAARNWLKAVGGKDLVFKIFTEAKQFAENTPEARRAWAVATLQKKAGELTGRPMPASVANLIIEFIYNEWKELNK
jgi:hypothetical protein